MPTDIKIAYTVAAGARTANIAEATFLARVERLDIAPVLYLRSGEQLRPVYDDAAILRVRAPFDRVRQFLPGVPEALILDAAPSLDAATARESAMLSAHNDPTKDASA